MAKPPAIASRRVMPGATEATGAFDGVESFFTRDECPNQASKSNGVISVRVSFAGRGLENPPTKEKISLFQDVKTSLAPKNESLALVGLGLSS